MSWKEIRAFCREQKLDTTDCQAPEDVYIMARNHMDTMILLGCCKKAPTPVSRVDCSVQAPKKQEKKMDFETNLTADERKAHFLNDRLWSAFYTHDSELIDHFKMHVNPAPQSPKEFIEFVKNGWFELNKNFLNEDGSYRDEANKPYWGTEFSRHVKEWKHPDRTPDREGYSVANGKLNSAREDAELAIKVGTVEEGRKALESFKAATFH